MNKCDFSYEHYISCLKDAQDRGYEFLKFEEYDKIKEDKKCIFMRHDVDHDLNLAHKMAKIEKENNISSTYFIRMHSSKYNLCSLEGTKIIRDICSLGHEIGFHYEPSYSRYFNIDEDALFTQDLVYLEQSLGKKIVSVSPHEPTREGTFKLSQDLLNQNGIKYQAYDDMFVRDMKYISDSSCNWREGGMHYFIADEVPKLCILTHPFWWFDITSLENY
jgi:hypothetical protein